MAHTKWSDENYKKSVKRHTDAISAGAPVIQSVDLSGIILGQGAVLAELVDKDLTAATITDVDFSALILTGHMNDGRFTRTNFSDSMIQQANLSRCFFSECDFSNSKMTLRFNNTRCEGTQFQNVTFSGVLDFVFQAQATQFIQCNFSQATFEQLEFDQAEFINCDFSHTIFNQVQLKNTHFTECNFTNSQWSKTPSAGSKFIHCNFDQTSSKL